jgi:5-formyltetrahydrofolate cyclo-ligase
MQVFGLMQMAKKALRKGILAKRRGLSAEILSEESTRITEFLCDWPVFAKAHTIMIFLSMADEVQTAHILQHALMAAKNVCIPHVGDEPGRMQAVQLKQLDDLVIGKFGIPTVSQEKKKIVEPESIDLVLVPGVAFDVAGRRLGMGAGYYDRFLLKANEAVWAGLCLSCQLVENVPCAEYDLSVHYLVTAKGIITC